MQVGDYNVTILLSKDTDTVEYYVTSHPSGHDPVRVFARLSKSLVNYSVSDLPKIYAEVFKSGAPVIGVKVMALVETEKGCPSIFLRDDGLGS